MEAILIGLCLGGFVFPPLWIVAVIVYEFGVRGGKTAAGLWLSSRFWD